MTATKQQRQRLIADWLRGGRIGSQEELVARLGLSGISATQTTVSRDLDELGAVKQRDEGAIRYLLPDRVDRSQASERLDRILGEWVVSIETAGSLVVMRTPPGSANLVASAMDAAGLPEVAGTIAGDDTIFVALCDGVTPGAGARMLRDRRARG
jgi:transcriptional regulator of arginine metabolism